MLLTGHSQQKCLLYFKDKNKYEALTFQKKYDITSEYLSDRVIIRRSKHYSGKRSIRLVISWYFGIVCSNGIFNW